jgi:hypothetical protein
MFYQNVRQQNTMTAHGISHDDKLSHLVKRRLCGPRMVGWQPHEPTAAFAALLLDQIIQLPLSPIGVNRRL